MRSWMTAACVATLSACSFMFSNYPEHWAPLRTVWFGCPDPSGSFVYYGEGVLNGKTKVTGGPGPRDHRLNLIEFIHPAVKSTITPEESKTLSEITHFTVSKESNNVLQLMPWIGRTSLPERMRRVPYECSRGQIVLTYSRREYRLSRARDGALVRYEGGWTCIPLPFACQYGYAWYRWKEVVNPTAPKA